MGNHRFNFVEAQEPSFGSRWLGPSLRFLTVAILSASASYIMLRWNGVRLF